MINAHLPDVSSVMRVQPRQQTLHIPQTNRTKVVTTVALAIILSGMGLIAFFAAGHVIPHSFNNGAFLFNSLGAVACLGAFFAAIVAVVEARRTNYFPVADQWIEWVERVKESAQGRATITSYDQKEYVSDWHLLYTFASSRPLFSIEGDCSENVDRLFSLTYTLAEADNFEETELDESSIDRRLVRSAIQRRLPCLPYDEGNSRTRHVYFSKELVSHVFKPLIPNSPLVKLVQEVPIAAPLMLFES